MSGTSLDGIDAVLAKIHADGQVQPLECVSAPFTPALREMLFQLQSTGTNEIHREHLAANDLAIAYVQVAETVLAKAQLQAKDIVAVGAHSAPAKLAKWSCLYTPNSQCSIVSGKIRYCCGR